MQLVNPNNINYGLIKNNNHKDAIPEWMDETFFDKLQEAKKPINMAGIYLGASKRDPQCANCGVTLANNEAIYCANCRKQLNNG